MSWLIVGTIPRDDFPLSEGRCRFGMVKDKRWDWIEENLK